MTVLRKSLPLDLSAMGNEGEFKATIATFNVVDKDGDVTLPGAFPAGKAVVISAYGHKSWDGALPVGKAVVGADQTKAWVEGNFFLTTTPGRDTYETVKALAAAGLGEWSYGYAVLGGSHNPAELSAWPGASRILKQLDVFEASAALVGVGEGTRTDYVKSANHLLTAGLSAKARALASGLKAGAIDPTVLATIAQVDLLADQLDELVDTLMDQFNIPDPDEDAEGEVEEPKSLSLDGHSRFTLAAVQGFLQRVKARSEMRLKDGRVLSGINRSRIVAHVSALSGVVTDLTELLDATNPAGTADGPEVELNAIWLDVQRRHAQLLHIA